MKIEILPVTTPPGQLAAAELHFTDSDPLAGLKLIGFGIWERRTGGRNVTFPARSYAVNGERRTFALLRPLADSTTNALRDQILAAYADWEHRHAPDTEHGPHNFEASPHFSDCCAICGENEGSHEVIV
jgi:hypothetical protein